MSAGSDEEPSPERPEGVGLAQRLLPPADQLGPDGQPRPSRMDRREQLVAVGLGFANVAIAAVSANAIQKQQGLAFLAGLAASVLTLVGARLGNRLVTMFGLFASVLTRSSSTAVFFVVGVPYYGAALWMFLRYNRLVKAQAVLRREQRSQGGGSRAASPRAARGAGKGSATRSTKARPTASKRYTPPKPVRKKPPPPTKPPRDRSIVD